MVASERRNWRAASARNSSRNPGVCTARASRPLFQHTARRGDADGRGSSACNSIGAWSLRTPLPGYS
eukprot:3067520-Pyramimonas_sp.AAC.1